MLAIGDRWHLTEIKKPVKQVRFRAGMARIVILYATAEGDTAPVAERMAQRLREQGYTVESLRACGRRHRYRRLARDVDPALSPHLKTA
jgi:flavorubredoxin